MTSNDTYDMSCNPETLVGTGAPGGGAVPQQLGQRQARRPKEATHLGVRLRLPSGELT